MLRHTALRCTLCLVTAGTALCGGPHVDRLRAAQPTVADDARAAATTVDLFDAMQQGLVDAKFVARSAERGRIVMTNKTDRPVLVEIPDAFIGVPEELAQMGGMMGGGMGGGMGGQQNVGGGGGGGRGGGGGGGRGFGGGGRGGGGGGGRGAFSVAPEQVTRVEVDLLCLDHGKREPSSSKAYVIRPVENFIQNPAVIELLKAFGNGELDPAAAQAAVWHLNSGVAWEELAAKLTGTDRQVVRAPYFNAAQLQLAQAIAQRAEELGAGRRIEPRPFRLPGDAADGDEAPQEEGVVEFVEDYEVRAAAGGAAE